MISGEIAAIPTPCSLPQAAYHLGGELFIISHEMITSLVFFFFFFSMRVFLLSQSMIGLIRYSMPSWWILISLSSNAHLTCALGLWSSAASRMNIYLRICSPLAIILKPTDWVINDCPLLEHGPSSYLHQLSLYCDLWFLLRFFRLWKDDASQLFVWTNPHWFRMHSAQQGKIIQKMETSHMLRTSARHFLSRSHT